MAGLLERLKERGTQTDAEWQASLDNLIKEFSAKNYFYLFGLTPASTVDTTRLKKTYNQLSKLIHPDKNMTKCFNGQCEELFALVSVAYQKLSDPDELKSYYQGLAPSGPQAGGPPTAASATTSTHRQHRTSATTRPSRQNRASSGPTVQSFFFFGCPPVETKVYSRDIAAGERINNGWGNNITINGNVYGDVSTTTGHITVNGHVFGNVTSATGAVIVGGSVTGQVYTAAGSISVKKKVCNRGSVISNIGNINVGYIGRAGTVTTTMGSIIVQTECKGAANSHCGQVVINGEVANKQSFVHLRM